MSAYLQALGSSLGIYNGSFTTRRHGPASGMDVDLVPSLCELGCLGVTSESSEHLYEEVWSFVRFMVSCIA